MMRSRSVTKRLTAFAAAIVLAATSIGASMSAYADPYELPIVPVVSAPEKYDLRNVGGKNYVTPVKFQGAYQTCWSFSVNAAAETNILLANGHGVAAGTENNNLDLSEKFTAWYAYAKLTEDDVQKGVIPKSQVGEGHFNSEDADNGAEIYLNGGTIKAALKLFANGMGPVREDAEVDDIKYFRYSGANEWVFPNYDATGLELAAEGSYVYGLISQQEPDYSEEQFWKDWEDETIRKGLILTVQGGAPNSYALYDDWTLPDGNEYRLCESAAVLKQFKVFDAYASKDKSGKMVFDQDGLDAVKKEISSGHAIACQIYGDGGDMSVMNTENWAQYIAKETEELQSNHGVTLVGYDDNYSKDNFARDNDEDGKTDADSIPPKNGAFIVKNSYGCVTAEDEKTAKVYPDGSKEYSRVGANEYGIDNSGYYYVSYYDATLEEFTSMDFFKAKEQKAADIDQYDFLCAQGVIPFSDEKARFANIFTAEQDEYLQEIGLYTLKANTKAEYSIYKNPTGSDPTTGTLLESGTKTFSEKGFYRFDLKGQYLINTGDKYAVVVQLTAKDGSETLESAVVPVTFKAATGIINSGESVFEQGGKWVDLSANADTVKQGVYDKLVEAEGIDAVKENCPDGKDSVIIDNFSIKGYTTPAAIRFAGNNRYDTAAKISSQSGLFEKSDVVVIANSMEFADALAGVPLAAAYNAPILLTGKDAVAKETVAEIKRLGAGKAIILGGVGAVSEKAEAAIKAAGCKQIERIAGGTRFETAVKIAEALAQKTGKAASEVFFVVYNNFADALSASTAAAVKGAPIIYVPDKTSIDKITSEYLAKVKGDVKNAYVVGGDGVIPDSIKKDIGTLLGGKDVERIAGADRYATCAEVNKKFADVLTGENVCVAKGLDFPDALAGGVYAALTKSPMILADKALNAAVTEYLSGSKATKVVVFGGTGAVSDDIVTQVYKCLKNA